MQPRPDINLSTTVMAHPRRRAQAEQLRRNHPELGIEIALDPEPGGKPATLRTAKLAWSTVREDATHHLVLQEDVTLSRDFVDVVIRALRVAPPGAISFFADWSMSTSQAIRLAALAGASWTPVVDRWTPTQALVLPAALAREFAGFADRYTESKPDNGAMAEFLAEHGLSAYVAIPNLVEHGSTESLLFNDLIHGIRDSTVFAGSENLGPEPFTGTVVTPPAVAHLGLGDFGAIGHIERVGAGSDGSWIESHKAVMSCGMTAVELADSFSADLARHREAGETGFSESLLFHLWLTMFVQGVIACGMLDAVGPGTFDARLNGNRWARPALGTFAAGALRRTCRPEILRETARQLTPLCITAMRSGFAGVDRWPGLRALWTPPRSTQSKAG